jgi:hypothetical protein
MERKLLIALRWIAVLSITAFTLPPSYASEPPMEQIKLLVADAFHYPVEKLTITLKDAPNGRTSFGVESGDGTFFPVTLDVGKRGSVLKPQFEAQLVAMISRMTEPRGSASGLRKVELSNNGYAYLGIGAGGPGGAQSGAIFVFPESGSEVAITVTASREESLNIEAAPKEYRALMSGHSTNMVGRITHLAEEVAAITEAATGVRRSGSSRGPHPGSPDGMRRQPPAAKPIAEAKVAPAMPSEGPESSAPLPWVCGAILLLAGAGGILFKTLRK